MSDEKQEIGNEKTSRHKKTIGKLMKYMIPVRKVDLPVVAGTIDLRFVDFLVLYENLLEKDEIQPVHAEVRPILTIEREPHLVLVVILRVMSGDVLYTTAIEIRQEPLADIFVLFRVWLEREADEEPMEFA